MDHACAIFLESTEYRDVGIDITMPIQKMCLTLSPLVSLMYRAKCFNPRVSKSPKCIAPKLTNMCLTLSPLVSLMYRAKCINPRVNNSPKCILWYSMVYYGMVVCYSVVWYCMVRYRMVWVLTIDGCSLQMGHMPIVYMTRST